MKILFSFVLLLSSFSSFALEQKPKKLVLIGDSLTEGFGVSREKAYPALLQKKIEKAGKDWRVVNGGVSGSTAASAASRVQWYTKDKPDLILLALGANDGLRGTAVKAVEDNLDKALAMCKKAGIPVVLIGIKLPPNYGADYTQKFEAIYPKLAARHKVQLIPFLLDKVAGDPEYNLTDGIHPNEKGHALIAETVYKAIEKLL